MRTKHPLTAKDKPKIRECIAAGMSFASAAKVIGCGRNQLSRFVRSEMAEELAEAEECRLDVAESQLQKLVEGGNLKAIIYLLDRRGKGRGYGVSQRLKVETEQKQVPPAVILAEMNRILGREEG